MNSIYDLSVTWAYSHRQALAGVRCDDACNTRLDVYLNTGTSTRSSPGVCSVFLSLSQSVAASTSHKPMGLQGLLQG
jgi:hypothetical protein